MKLLNKKYSHKMAIILEIIKYKNIPNDSFISDVCFRMFYKLICFLLHAMESKKIISKCKL